jgi:hypothetical protein
MFLKTASIESSGIKDPASGYEIWVSVTIRKFWRETYSTPDQDFSKMRNADLNQVIARKFSDSSDKVTRRFPLKDSQNFPEEFAELRNMRGTTMFFVSGVKDGRIVIFSIQSAYKKEKGYKKTDIHEKTSVQDPLSGAEIVTTVGVRRKWREMIGSKDPSGAIIRNKELSQVIAQEFASSRRIRKFPLKLSSDIKMEREYAELRRMESYPFYFISGVKGGKIYIFGIQSEILTGKKR